MSLLGYFAAIFSAVAVVSSVEPSSTIMISNVRAFREGAVRWDIVASIMVGKRSVSLYAGTTTVNSTELGSARGVNGRNFLDDL